MAERDDFFSLLEKFTTIGVELERQLEKVPEQFRDDEAIRDCAAGRKTRPGQFIEESWRGCSALRERLGLLRKSKRLERRLRREFPSDFKIHLSEVASSIRG